MTRYLLDTNIISNATKPEPSAPLLSWLSAQPDANLFIASLTLAEIRRGILDKPPGRKRDAGGDHGADAVPDEGDVVQVEFFADLEEVGGVAVEGGVAGAVVGVGVEAAGAGLVQQYDAVVGGGGGQDPVPGCLVGAEAVQEEQDGCFVAVGVVEDADVVALRSGAGCGGADSLGRGSGHCSSFPGVSAWRRTASNIPASMTARS